MKKQIHQLVHTLSYGDAISGEVIALQKCLQQIGYDSEIYAINVHPFYQGKAKKYLDFPTQFAGELILHYSLGSPLNQLYLGLTKAYRSLIYHNITPAKWFAGVNPRITSDIEQGLSELDNLLKNTHRILADSSFNAKELADLGYKAQVLPLTIDPDKWALESNPGIDNLLKTEGGVHLLHVGRLAPNKCVEDIIKIFYFFHHSICKKSKLWLVGIDIDTEIYSFSLKRLVHELRLDAAVVFTGCFADSEVKALYQNASCYLCMSEHEGFCLPVIEAMHFGVPVVAYDSTALPDTMADAGILVKEKRHAEIAELVGLISEQQDFRAQLIAAGTKRAQALNFENFSKNVNAIWQL